MPTIKKPTTKARPCGRTELTAGNQKIKKAPANRLKLPHRKLVSGEELAMPLGLEKGEGNGSPLRPQTKWGMQLLKKAPAKKKVK